MTLITRRPLLLFQLIRYVFYYLLLSTMTGACTKWMFKMLSFKEHLKKRCVWPQDLTRGLHSTTGHNHIYYLRAHSCCGDGIPLKRSFRHLALFANVRGMSRFSLLMCSKVSPLMLQTPQVITSLYDCEWKRAHWSEEKIENANKTYWITRICYFIFILVDAVLKALVRVTILLSRFARLTRPGMSVIIRNLNR